MNTDNMVQAGLALLELGEATAARKLQPMDVVRTASAVLVAVAPLEDLKKALDDADRARIDRAAELAAEAKMGPRP